MCSWQPVVLLMLCAYAVHCGDGSATGPSQEMSQATKDETILNLLEKLNALMTIFDARGYQSQGKPGIDDRLGAGESQGPRQEGEKHLSTSVEDSVRTENRGNGASSEGHVSQLTVRVPPQTVSGGAEQSAVGSVSKEQTSAIEILDRLLSGDDNALVKPADSSRSDDKSSGAYREDRRRSGSESSHSQPIERTRNSKHVPLTNYWSAESNEGDEGNPRAVMSSNRSGSASDEGSSSEEIVEEFYRVVNQKFKSRGLFSGVAREKLIQRLCAGCSTKRKQLISSPSPTTLTTARKTTSEAPTTQRPVEEAVTIAQGPSSHPTIGQATSSWPSETLSTESIGTEPGPPTFEAKPFEKDATSPILPPDGGSKENETTPTTVVEQQQFNPLGEGSKANITEHLASGTDVVPLTKIEQVDRGESVMVTETTSGIQPSMSILDESTKETQTSVFGVTQESLLVQPTSADAGVSIGSPGSSENVVVSLPDAEAASLLVEQTTSLPLPNVTSVVGSQSALGSVAPLKERLSVGVAIDGEAASASAIGSAPLSNPSAEEPNADMAGAAGATFEASSLVKTADVPKSELIASGEDPPAFPEIKQQEIRRPDVGTTVSNFEPSVVEESYSVEEDAPSVSSSVDALFLPELPTSNEGSIAETQGETLWESHSAGGTTAPLTRSIQNNFGASGGQPASGQETTQMREESGDTNLLSSDNGGTSHQNVVEIEQAQLTTTVLSLSTAESALPSTQDADGFESENVDLLSDLDLTGGSAQKVESEGGPLVTQTFSDGITAPKLEEAKLPSSVGSQEGSGGSDSTTSLESATAKASGEPVVDGSDLTTRSLDEGTVITTTPTPQNVGREKEETSDSNAAEIMLSLLEPNAKLAVGSSINASSSVQETTASDGLNVSTPSIASNQNVVPGSTNAPLIDSAASSLSFDQAVTNGADMVKFGVSPSATTLNDRSLTENDVVLETETATSGTDLTTEEAARNAAVQISSRSEVPRLSNVTEMLLPVSNETQNANSNERHLVQENVLGNGPGRGSADAEGAQLSTGTPGLSRVSVSPSLGPRIANGIANDEVTSENSAGSLENATQSSPSLNIQADKEGSQAASGPALSPDVTGNLIDTEKANSLTGLHEAPSKKVETSSGIKNGTTVFPQTAEVESYMNFSSGANVSAGEERVSPSIEPKHGSDGHVGEEKLGGAGVPAAPVNAQHSAGFSPAIDTEQGTNQSGSFEPSAGSALPSPSVSISAETGNPVFSAPSTQPLAGQTVSVAQSNKAQLGPFSNLYRPGAWPRRIISDRHQKVNWNGVLRQLGFFNADKMETAITGMRPSSERINDTRTVPAASTELPTKAASLSNSGDREIADNVIAASEKSSSVDSATETFSTPTGRNNLQELTTLVSNPPDQRVPSTTTATTTGTTAVITAATVTAQEALSTKKPNTTSAAIAALTTTPKPTTGAPIQSGNELGLNGQTNPPELEDVAETVDDVIDELRLSSSFARPEASPFESFTGKSPHLCGNEYHPILTIFKLLKRRGIYDLYKRSQCEVDYHIHCKYSWKYCDSFEALTFCPKTCKDSNCTRLKQYGYNEVEKPVYLSQCIDTKAHDCPALSGRGDCFTNPHSMAFLCPDSCKFCGVDEEYLPFMPEAEKLIVWLQNYRDGHYRAYADYVHSRILLLHAKAKKGIC